jgi:hypothetical protein
MHSDESISISKLEFEDIIKEELENRGHRVDYEIIIEELYRSDLFRIFDRRIEFRHLLLQEFFAGRAIPTLEFIKYRISDDWWRRAIVFFFGEKPDSVGDLEEISKSLKVENGNNTEVLNGSTTIGLALQACYLSQVSQKLSVWKRVAQSLGTISHTPENGDAKYPVTNFAFNFLLSRDAVALSDIGEAKEELLRWAKSSGDLLDHKDAIVFWLVTGLMETGNFEEARRIIRDKGVINPRYLLGIHMTCHLAIEVRYLDRSQKEAARDIRNDVQEKVQGEVKKLLDEFGSQLLELRKGNVEALG